MANWFCSSAQYTAVAQWATAHVYAPGAIVRQLAAPAFGSERCFRTAAGGTSHATTEPTWVLTKASASPTDNTITDWTEVTGNSTYNWTAAAATLIHIGLWMAAGDTCWLGDDHAETTSAANTIAIAGTSAVPSSVLCIDHTKTSFTPSDLRTTASVSTTGASSLILGTSVYWYGVTFTAGTGSSAASMTLSSQYSKFEQCKFVAGTTGTGFRIVTGSDTNLVDCTAKFANANQAFQTTNLMWKNPSGILPIDPSGSMPTTLNSTNAGIITFEGMNLTNFTGSFVGPVNGVAVSTLKDCLLSASAVVTTLTQLPNANQLNLIRCSSPGSPNRTERYQANGTLTTDLTVVRTGGASDGVAPSCWKTVTTATCLAWWQPFQMFPISIWNTVLQNNVNATVEGIASPVAFSALPNNDEFWIEFEYLGTSGGLGAYRQGTKPTVLDTGTALTASTQAWDSKATARVNSQTYAAGDVIKLASNPGRLFFCTTGGAAAGSEPGGYASAVDGGSVTDNAATFKAGWRFKQTVVLASPQPQMVGPITVYPKMAKASATLYLDPLIVLS